MSSEPIENIPQPNPPPEATSASPSNPKCPRRIRRLWGLATVCSLLTVAFLTFSEHWGPYLLEAYIRSTIATPELDGALESVDYITLRSLKMRGLSLNAIPGAPSIECIKAHYSLGEILCNRRFNTLDITGIHMNLGEAMPSNAAALFTDTTFDADIYLQKKLGGPGMTASLSAHALDWFLSGIATIAIAPTNTFSLTASGALELQDSPWSLRFEATANTNGWNLAANFPNSIEFAQTDPVLGPITQRALAQAPTVTDLAFHGFLAAGVTVESTQARPLPTWSTRLALTNATLSASIAETPIALEGIQTRVALSGIAEHWDLRPVWLSMRSGSFGNWEVGRGYAHLLADEHSIMITKASLDFCGGLIQLFAFSFLPESLSAGFTLFLDDIDAGEFLRHLPQFQGEATGRLQGKIPLYIHGGNQIRLQRISLYSPPGEIGTLHMYDTSLITQQLAASGLPNATCKNLSKALANLNFNVLRLDLTPGSRDHSENAALALRLEGSATEGNKTVPVNLAVTFHGALENLLNLGVRAATSTPKNTHP